ncbi:peptidyl-dipeptidase Dcp [Thermophagus xiamenensis]|uniref:Dipeptidyl carboxypeptidase n=1 Tax=Thermophagus xiamenensis TaxID=385682 RepID=A0A1I2BSF4_9BACT|nr:peptidyl-dipeptidase Dcp [Thermophagus xiamenensis]SFE59029.1 peptidyl-dipeptidase Dcp [Thermophagus xiamenensis]
MRKINLISTVALAIIMSACGNGKSAHQDDEALKNNPLMKESTLPYHAPDFAAIENSHFKPALEAGIKEKLAEIEAIANNPEPPTFENTLVALEKSGHTLNRVYGIFNMLTGANTNPELQAVEEEIAPRMASLSDAIFLNEKMFQRVKSIYNQLDQLNLDAESRRLVEYYYERFVLAGANLSPEDKEKMKKLNEEEALLRTQFANRLLAAAKKGALVVEDKSKLKGLSDAELEALKQERDGKTVYVLPLLNTTQQPLFSSLDDRETRRELFLKSVSRASQGDENDTREIIKRIASIRAEQAQLLGFKNYAEWNLKDQMAQTPEAANKFMAELVPATVAKAKKEAQELQKLIDREGGNFKLEPWDWSYYAAKLQKAKYDLDENEIKPYFELNRVLEDGVFFAATKLYGITFKERHDIPVYSDDMRVFEIFNEDGSAVGLFYVDYFKRDNKAGGAWMSEIIGQSRLLNQKPVIYNVCNFPKPAEGEPALLTYDNVTTMFHEFGHALHGLLSDQKYPSLAGTNVSRDFVELPSQINEHWALYPEVFNNYAKHYKTGEPMPKELVDKVVKASKFNQGFALAEVLAAAGLDMQWHTITTDTSIDDVEAFEKQALENINLLIPQIPPRYSSPYFLHIWGHGYAAGYYAYLWAEMLDNDAFAWFMENGGLTRENGQRFREMILSRGNSEDLHKMFVDFRGKEPDITPMLKHRGLID